MKSINTYVIVYYDIENGVYLTKSDFEKVIRGMTEFEINSRFIPFVKSI